MVETDPGFLAADSTYDSEDDCHPKGKLCPRFWIKFGGVPLIFA